MSKLEKTTHICLILVSTISALILIRSQFVHRTVAKGKAVVVSSINEPIKIPSVDWSASPVSVVLQLHDDCPFCKESVPFYKKLWKQRSEAHSMRLYVASQQPQSTISQYLTANGISNDGVILTPNGIGGESIVHTPTLLLVDASGVIIRKYVGLLDFSQEQDVLARINQGMEARSHSN